MNKSLFETDRRPLPDEVATWLVKEIQGGRFASGTHLPSERNLAEQFGVSRAVVREALSQLKSDGLISAQQGRGVLVNATEQHLSFRLSGASIHSKKEFQDALELLMAFEVAAARYAGKRRTTKDIKEIEKGLVGMDYAIINDQPTYDQDFAFHLAIVEATHNPHFRRLNGYLEKCVRRFIRKAATNTAAHHKNAIPMVRKEHQAIFDAIVARDPEAAAKAAEQHLINVAKRLNL